MLFNKTTMRGCFGAGAMGATRCCRCSWRTVPRSRRRSTTPTRSRNACRCSAAAAPPRTPLWRPPSLRAASQEADTPSDPSSARAHMRDDVRMQAKWVASAPKHIDERVQHACMAARRRPPFNRARAPQQWQASRISPQAHTGFTHTHTHTCSGATGKVSEGSASTSNTSGGS